MDSVKILEVELEDVGMISNIVQSSLINNDAYSIEAREGYLKENSVEGLKRLFSSHLKSWLKAEYQGNIIGVILGWFHGGVQDLQWITVADEYRRSGLHVGTELINGLKEKLKEKNPRQIQALTNTKLGNVDFFIKNGFEITETITNYFFGDNYHQLRHYF